ncbi:MAG: hypothetical protein QE263_08135 [Vampirovibrionales bacterium]|nr:hypothetical protein [Vampirovibrionales bacterium]
MATSFSLGLSLGWATELPTPSMSPDPAVVASLAPASAATEPVATPAEPPLMKIKTTYKALSGIVVLPVPPLNSRKAFSDVSTVVANELALHLQRQHPESRIQSPGLIVDALKRQGYTATYNEAMQQVHRTGSPSPSTLGYLLDAIQSLGFDADVARVVFVDADVETHRPDRSWNIKDKARQWITDELPSDNRYYVNAHLRVFDTEAPHLPCIFSGSWIHPVKTNRFGNVTASVFDSGDSLNSFTGVSGVLSKALVLRAPKATYAQPVQSMVPVKVQVLGKITQRPAAKAGSSKAGSTPSF